MAGKRDVAVFAGIIDTAALHFDGDDVRRFMVVQTTRLGIQMQSSDLWIYWMDGRAGILFLFS
jgi:3-methyladenine DNA glycosylase Mpg